VHIGGVAVEQPPDVQHHVDLGGSGGHQLPGLGDLGGRGRVAVREPGHGADEHLRPGERGDREAHVGRAHAHRRRVAGGGEGAARAHLVGGELGPQQRVVDHLRDRGGFGEHLLGVHGPSSTSKVTCRA
jgi:hypothetical protein